MTHVHKQLIRDSMKAKIAKNVDLFEIERLMGLSIDSLQTDDLTPEQISASHSTLGLDAQLIEGGTWFLYLDRGLACRLWRVVVSVNALRRQSFSRTKYHAFQPRLRQARIWAMYAHPNFRHQGVGRLILETSKAAAKTVRFNALEMVATLVGELFYARCGYS